MSKILLIKANDRPADQAISSKMYETFVSTYKEANTTDEIIELDLYNLDLPYYGNDAITGVYKRNLGMELTAEEAKGAALVDTYLNQFLSVDKVVMAFPLWNATVPAPLISYLSYLSQAGQVFKYTAEGPVGLVGDKKVALLNAVGSDNGTEGTAVELVKTMISLWGITNPETVVIKGHNQFPDRSEAIIADGLEAVAKLAAKF